jgi:hypothetical protein
MMIKVKMMNCESDDFKIMACILQFDCFIHTMERFTVERLVYDGSDPSDDWVITGIGHSKLNIGNVATIPIESYNDYIRKSHPWR